MDLHFLNEQLGLVKDLAARTSGNAWHIEERDGSIAIKDSNGGLVAVSGVDSIHSMDNMRFIVAAKSLVEHLRQFADNCGLSDAPESLVDLKLKLEEAEDRIERLEAREEALLAEMWDIEKSYRLEINKLEERLEYEGR